MIGHQDLDPGEHDSGPSSAPRPPSDRRPGRRRAPARLSGEGGALLHGAVVLLVYLGVFLLFFSPALIAGQVLAPSDATLYYLPNCYSPIGLWDPRLLSGFPVAADPQAMTWYPLSLLACHVAHSFNAFVISAYVLASAFTYGYVHRLTGSRLAALASGLVYGMSGFMMAHLGHTTIIHGAVWPPLLVWSLDELRRAPRARWFAVLVVAVACSALGGHPQMFAYGLGLALAYALVVGLLSRAAPRFYGYVVAGLVLGFALAAVQLLPTAELVGLGPRASMSFDDFVSYSLPPPQTATLLFPFAFGAMLESPYSPKYFGAWNLTELTGYCGLVPLMAALVGLVASRRRSFAYFWFAVAAVALVLALGDGTRVAGWMYAVPGYNKFRAPARNLSELALAVAVLAGLGIAAVEERRVPGWMALAGIAGVALAGLALLMAAAPQIRGAGHLGVEDALDMAPWSNRSIGVPTIVGLLGGGLLLCWRARPDASWRRLALLTILVADLASFGWFYEWRYRSPSAGELAPDASARSYRAALVASDQRMLTMRGGVGGRGEIPPNVSRLWDIPSAGGYGPIPLSRVSELLAMDPAGQVASVMLSAQNRGLDIMGVRYLFVPTKNPYVYPPSTMVDDEHRITWAEQDLDVLLGHGCAAPGADAVDFSLPAPVDATGIALVTSLACSTEVPDRAPVVRLLVDDGNGHVDATELRAGADTSEWAFDRKDVRPWVKHGRATVFESFANAAGGSDGHKYLGVLPLARPTAVQRIHAEWTGPSGAIRIYKVSLVGGAGGRSSPLIPGDHALTDAARWRHVEDVGEASVYENLHALPRAWLVSDVVAADPEAVLHAVQTSALPDGRAYDPSRTALVERPIGFATSGLDATDQARVTPRSATEVAVDTRSAARAFLVLSDVDYPGWSAAIDGVSTPIFRTNYVQRGVVVPAGAHTVVFRFRPGSFYAGAGLSLVALVVVVGIVGRDHARRRRVA